MKEPTAPTFEALDQLPEDSNPPVYPEVSRDIYSIPVGRQPQPIPLARRSSREFLPVYPARHQAFFREEDTRTALPIAIMFVPKAIDALPEDEKYKLKGLFVGKINRPYFFGVFKYQSLASSLSETHTVEVSRAQIQLLDLIGCENFPLTRFQRTDTSFVLFFADSSKGINLTYAKNIQGFLPNGQFHSITYDHSKIAFTPCSLDELKSESTQLVEKIKGITQYGCSILARELLTKVSDHVLKNGIKVAEPIEAAPAVINIPAPEAPKSILDNIKDIFRMKK